MRIWNVSVNRPRKIIITTGDIDGIGTEVTAKALVRLKPQKDIQFYLWRSPHCPRKYLHLIDQCFRRRTVQSWPEALSLTKYAKNEIIDICSNLSPATWVELSAQASFLGQADALTTAPLSKTEIHSSGYNCLGHTEILKKVTQTSSPLFMGFLGKKFNVLLTTSHIPIHQVSFSLNEDIVLNSLRAGDNLRRQLDSRIRSKPMALLGLNPHAGEKNLIGTEEEAIIYPALLKAKKINLNVEGPLVPDSAFRKENWNRYSLFIALYHDQGLIPFKLVHGSKSGVHITVGLPFIRTSVDHGTAKNIFGKNKADAGSMYDALKWAIKLSKQENK